MAKNEKSAYLKSKRKTNPKMPTVTTPGLHRGILKNTDVLCYRMKAETWPSTRRVAMENVHREKSEDTLQNPIQSKYSFEKITWNPHRTKLNDSPKMENSHRELQNSTKAKTPFEKYPIASSSSLQIIKSQNFPMLSLNWYRSKQENAHRKKVEDPSQNFYRSPIIQSLNPHSGKFEDTLVEKLKAPETPSENIKVPEIPSEKVKWPKIPSENFKWPELPRETLEDYRNATSFNTSGRINLSALGPVPNTRISVQTEKRPKSVKAKSVESQEDIENDDKSEVYSIWPARKSLFPNIPPYIKFIMYDRMPNTLPSVGRLHLRWKVSNALTYVIKKTVINTGFLLVSENSKDSDEWMSTWGLPMRLPLYKTLKTSQKVNHFAGSFHLGRKDLLWLNLHRMMLNYGTKIFGIIPQTYILPRDLKALEKNWIYKDGIGGEKWILKPPAGYGGFGIRVINKWEQLPKETFLIVQKYIDDPYLIKGSKFDFRLFVLVTSFDPLRIYLYTEGLVRFACVQYSDKDDDLKDQFMHLTNCCINRKSSRYTVNEDANTCHGHEWTLTKLWEYMSHRGVKTDALWAEIKRLVIKTIIAGELPIVDTCAENVRSRYNCYQVFGFDVMFDQHLKPWLLEVNTSPSFLTDLPVDRYVKAPLIHTLFNIVQFHFPPKLSVHQYSPPCFDERLYTTKLQDKEIEKHNYFLKITKRKNYLYDILDQLTGDDIRVLTRAEDELVVKHDFERIFPTAKTHTYLEFMPNRYYNRLCDAWECKYEHNRQKGINRLKKLCLKKLHLQVPLHRSERSLNTSQASTKLPRSSKEGQVKPEVVVEENQASTKLPRSSKEGQVKPEVVVEENQASTKLPRSPKEGQVKPEVVVAEGAEKTTATSRGL